MKINNILMVGAFIAISLSSGLYAADCPCENGTADFTVDCDKNGIMDACNEADCPGCENGRDNPSEGMQCCNGKEIPEDETCLSINGASTVLVGDGTTLTVSGGVAPYEWSAEDENILYIGQEGDAESVNVSTSGYGVTKITVTDSDENSASINYTVLLVRLKPNGEEKDGLIIVRDGDESTVELTVLPEGNDDALKDVKIKALMDNGSDVFDNPAGDGLTFERVDETLEWKIPNVRWFAPSDDKCYRRSTYKLEANFKLDGGRDSVQKITDNRFTASVHEDDGNIAFAWVEDQYLQGSPEMVINEVTINGITSYRIAGFTIDNVVRKVVPLIVVNIPEKSQFYNMTKSEEDIHGEQYIADNQNYNVVDKDLHWSPGKVLVMANASIVELNMGEFDFDTPEPAYEVMTFLWNKAVKQHRDIVTQAFASGSPLRCDLEREAKNAISPPVSHFITMECSYKNCN